MKKRKLKKWVVWLIRIILLGLLVVITYQLFTKTETYITPVGKYKCKGGIIKVCSGSKLVREYLGD